MERSVLAALCQYFLLNSKSVNDIDDELERMARCMIQEHLPVVHIWKMPHEYEIEYAAIRHEKLCAEVTPHFPGVISALICGFISDISFTKVNARADIDTVTLNGNHFCDTTVSLKNATINGAVFSNVTITDITGTTMIGCVFVNCTLLNTSNSVLKKCRFASVTIGNVENTKCRSCIFDRVSIRFAKFSDTEFVGCTITKIAVVESTMSDMKIVGCVIDNMRLMTVTLQELSVSFSFLSTMLFGRNSKLTDVGVKRCHVKKVCVCNSQLQGCSVYDSKLSSIVLLQSQFDVCVLLGHVSDLYRHMCTLTQCYFPTQKLHTLPYVIKSKHKRAPKHNSNRGFIIQKLNTSNVLGFR